MTRMIERFRVNEPNAYAWGFAPDEPCHVRVVALYAYDDQPAEWRAYVDWQVRPDGLVRPSGWVRAAKLVACPACAGSRTVPSMSGLSDIDCEVCK